MGSEEGSFKTPIGKFRIAEKIGDGMLRWEPCSKAAAPVKATKKLLRDEDLVMTRILWLDGLDRGNANTHGRYIYIHGTNHEDRDRHAGKPWLCPDEECRFGGALRPRRRGTPVRDPALTKGRRALEKSREKRCVRGLNCLNDGCNLQGKEAKYYVKIFKAIMIVAIAAGALSLGACAQKKEAVTTTSTYSK